MSKRKRGNNAFPGSVVRIVKSLFADYARREKIIKFSSITGPVLARYVEINAAIDAAMETAEAGIRAELFDDIVHGRGYEASQLAPLMAKNTYYARKKKVMLTVAKILWLI